MAETFETVKRGYYGVNPKRKDSITQEDAKNKFEEFLLWSKANPVRAGGLALLIALFIFTAFVV